MAPGGSTTLQWIAPITRTIWTAHIEINRLKKKSQIVEGVREVKVDLEKVKENMKKIHSIKIVKGFKFFFLRGRIKGRIPRIYSI